MPRARREQLILDVAGAIFARAGFHSASMDEIARSAGVSKPMVYAYFGSKEGLYLAYIDRAGRELLERLVVVAPAAGRSAPRLHGRVTEFLAFVEEHRDGWRVLSQEAVSSAPVAEEVAKLRRSITEVLRRMIEDGPDSGRGYSGAAADAIAHAIVGAGESLANWWLDHPELPRGTVADWYAQVVRAVLAGPSPPPSPRS